MGFNRACIVQWGRGRVVLALSLSGGLLFLLMFAGFYFWTPRLNPQEAQKRVRACLLREVSQRHMNELKSHALDVPDLVMATRWKTEMDDIHSLEFVRVEIKRLIPDILLSPDAPSYVVQAVFVGEEEPRTFIISWDGVDREASSAVWMFCL